MPMKAPRICACGYAVREQCPCERRRAQESKARFDAKRPSARARGYDSEWRLARADFLIANPTCRCITIGRTCGAPATIVHHVIPHKGNKALFWSRTNWMPVCKPCHDGPLQSQEKRQ